MSGFEKQGGELSGRRLRELVDYDWETGIFTRRVTLTNSQKAGSVAGSKPNVNGYIMISIVGRLYYAHRLAWLYVYGMWPHGEIDHIDGNRSNNRLGNLRVCTTAENAQNSSIKSNNKSGFVGVYFDKATGRWRAQIKTAGKTTQLGRFDTAENASAAYKAAKQRSHPFNPVLRVQP